MTTTPAGWYPDPYGSPLLRWWDGSQWTDATHPYEPGAGVGGAQTVREEARAEADQASGEPTGATPQSGDEQAERQGKPAFQPPGGPGARPAGEQDAESRSGPGLSSLGTTGPGLASLGTTGPQTSGGPSSPPSGGPSSPPSGGPSFAPPGGAPEQSASGPSFAPPGGAPEQSAQPPWGPPGGQPGQQSPQPGQQSPQAGQQGTQPGQQGTGPHQGQYAGAPGQTAQYPGQPGPAGQTAQYPGQPGQTAQYPGQPGQGGQYPGQGGQYPGQSGQAGQYGAYGQQYAQGYPAQTAQLPVPEFGQPQRASFWPWVIGGIALVTAVALVVAAAVFFVNRSGTPIASRTSAPPSSVPEDSVVPPEQTERPPSPLQQGPLPQPADGRINDPVTGLSYAYPGQPWQVPQPTEINDPSRIELPQWTSGYEALSQENFQGESDWVGSVFAAPLPQVFPYQGPEQLKATVGTLLVAYESTFYSPRHERKILRNKAIKVSGHDAWLTEFELDFTAQAEANGWKWKKEKGAYVLVDKGPSERPALLYVSVPDNLDQSVLDDVLGSLKLR